MSKSKCHSVTRSPIELFWTAKNLCISLLAIVRHLFHRHNHHQRNYSTDLIFLWVERSALAFYMLHLKNLYSAAVYVECMSNICWLPFLCFRTTSLNRSWMEPASSPRWYRSWWSFWFRNFHSVILKHFCSTRKDQRQWCSSQYCFDLGTCWGRWCCCPSCLPSSPRTPWTQSRRSSSCSFQMFWCSSIDNENPMHGFLRSRKSIHSKSQKVCGTAFSVKKNCGKVRKSRRHFWANWDNFGSF